MSWEKYLFLKAAEEASEVSKEAIKVALFGKQSGEYNNLEKFVTEIIELYVVFEEVIKVLLDKGIPAQFSEAAAETIKEDKRVRLKEYYACSEL